MRTPDFGPPKSHPTAGTIAIGARPFLVAYNVYLGDASNIGVAKEVAKAVRGSSGGLKNVKAMGLEVDGQAQVSMNLVDIEKTPMFRAYDMVKMEAAAHGVSPTWSELVGLVPERAIIDSAARYLQLRNFSTEQLLEHKVRAAASDGISLSAFRAAIASSNPAPGGGSAAAHAGSIAAALVQMVAGLTIGKKKYADVEEHFKDIALKAASLGQRLAELVDLDAQSYDAVSMAYKLPKATPEQETLRKAAITAALIGASEVPLETARACATVAELAENRGAQGKYERALRCRRGGVDGRGGVQGRGVQREGERRRARRFGGGAWAHGGGGEFRAHGERGGESNGGAGAARLGWRWRCDHAAAVADRIVVIRFGWLRSARRRDELKVQIIAGAVLVVDEPDLTVRGAGGHVALARQIAAEGRVGAGAPVRRKRRGHVIRDL